MYALIGVGVFIFLLSFYLWHLNRAIGGVPDQAQRLSPHRWTPEEVKAAYAKIEKSPINYASHLPPKLERRYVVVGGSGLVGGSIILHLLARGQPPESIRLIDFRPPVRADLLSNEKVSRVDFVQVDITSETSTNEAFNKPWPKSVANLPLTVFHTAAVIDPSNRAKSLLYRCAGVNTTGTTHVVNAAQASGADIFVATSSASLDIFPVDFWIAPWSKWPRRFVQVNGGEVDVTKPVRSHDEYFGNYAVSKAAAEKIVLNANAPGFKTGTLRPANGIFGNRYDHTVGTYMSMGKVPTWIPHIIQNFVYAPNVSVAHLQYEAALLTPNTTCSGKTYVITDPNPPISFSDIYTLISTVSITPFEAQIIPPLPLFLFSYLIETYLLLQHTLQQTLPSVLGKLLPILPADIAMLQPALFSISCAHVIFSDDHARKSVSEGGLGYKGICTTLEGMCMQAREWNLEHQDASLNEIKKRKQMGNGELEMKNLGGVGAATKA